MRTLLLALLSLLVLAAAQAGNSALRDDRTRDVCIIGAGAAGMSAAVFLKDRGYDTLVFEIAPQVGGHCNTIRTGAPQFSPTGDLLYPGYIDVGVVVYQDTQKANASGKGLWSLDAKKFAQRFVNTSTLDFTSSQRRGADAPTIGVDLNLGFVPPVPSQTPEEQQAFFAALSAAIGRIYATTLLYPWLNTGKRPDPIPPFFLEPFTNFIKNQSLEILIQPIFFGLLTGGGMGTLERLTTVEALQVLAPVTLDLFTVPDSGFVVQGGCQILYDQMAGYIGSANIRVNAQVRAVNRRGSRVVISGFSNGAPCPRFEKGRPLDGDDDDDDDDDNGDRRGGNNGKRPFVYNCRKLIMGVYPVLPNLRMLDLSNEEYSLFSQVQANYYMAITVNATGGSLANSPFTINNVNVQNVAGGFQSLLPSLSTLTRNFPAGPIAAYVNSDSEVPLTFNQALKLATDGFAKIPANLLSNFTVINVDYHLYDPHFKPAALAARPSADTRFTQLQGKQNTFWAGAATRYDASSVVWNQAFELISANFPKKN